MLNDRVNQLTLADNSRLAEINSLLSEKVRLERKLQTNRDTLKSATDTLQIPEVKKFVNDYVTRRQHNETLQFKVGILIDLFI